VSERFLLIPLRYWLFTPELQWPSRGKSRVLQGCKRGTPGADPWLSVQQHPDGIVYGENGYAGHNTDDALNFGGANVWVNSIEPSPYDIAANGFAHVKWEQEDWYLVRRASGPKKWHPSNDNAQGTVAYGKYSTDALSDSTFSMLYKQYTWDKIMFASGDLSMYVVMGRDVVGTFPDINCANCPLKLLASNEGKAHKGGQIVKQYMRKGCCAEDPWISAGHHPTEIVYGENGYGGHNTDDALNFGGANVWVNKVSLQQPTVDVIKSKDGRSFAHMKFLKRDWYLVRRVPPGQTWHPANDQLAGTATYGKLSSDALSKAAAFSVPFAKLRWGEMLLASGDMRYWLVLDRSTVEECSTGKVNGQWHPPFIGASDASEGKVTQYCRAGAKEGE
jgi:hypothetical protein